MALAGFPLKHPALSPEPLEGARYRQHSTGGSLPSASAASGAGEGCVYPAALARMLISRGVLSLPWRGDLMPGLPTQIFCACRLS